MVDEARPAPRSKRGTGPADVEAALRAIKVDGLVELPLDGLPEPAAAWLDALISRAEKDGIELTWTARDDLLRVIDMEA